MHSRYDGYSFPLRNTVTREKVRFHNRYGIELAGDLYLPREVDGKLAAVAVSGPFGAVKEQCRTVCGRIGRPGICRSGL